MRIGAVQLRDFTARDGARLRADLEKAGVGPAATRKTLTILQGIFACAVRWGHVQVNPLVAVTKPSAKRKRAIVPPAPVAVEAMRADLRAQGRLLDATLIAVLAYAGLRPGEALALGWEHVKDRLLLVERALDNGAFKETKNRKIRTVEVVAPLSADLAEWRLASGRPPQDALVFPTPRGTAWADHDYKNWQRRIFVPTAERAGLQDANPYHLRHAFCFLLIRQTNDATEVARPGTRRA